MERPCWLKSVDGRHVRKNKHCELIKANKMLHIMCHVTVAAQIENSNYKTAQCTHTYNGHNIIQNGSYCNEHNKVKLDISIIGWMLCKYAHLLNGCLMPVSFDPFIKRSADSLATHQTIQEVHTLQVRIQFYEYFTHSATALLYNWYFR